MQIVPVLVVSFTPNGCALIDQLLQADSTAIVSGIAIGLFILNAGLFGAVRARFKRAGLILDRWKELSMQPSIFDLLFVLTAAAFNLLIASLFIVTKRMQLKLIRAFGTAWLLLAFPLAIVFVNYLLIGKEVAIMVAFGGVFFYMLVEWLLDYVWKIDFRSKLSRHIPYILLEYVALFSLIGIAFSIDRAAGIVVSICFWILMASLIYLYTGNNKQAA